MGGGAEPSKEILEEELSNAQYLICADGGGNCLYKHNIIPDYLLGDFDSIDKDILDFFIAKHCIVETYPKEKNYTDSEICFNKAIELSVTEITMLGFTGSRLDHMLGNLGLLNKCLTRGIKGVIRDNNNKIFITNQNSIIKREVNKFFSLQAYSDIVENLTIIGAKYPLNNYKLFKGDTRTISNEFNNQDIQIKFDTGTLLIIIATD